jgi:hypothetical protein
MFSKLFKKQQEANEKIGSLSDLLILGDETGWKLPDNDSLKVDKLDYSMDSLTHLDDYLERVRKIVKNLSNDDLSKIILRSGAYTGEVIRRNSKENFEWRTYDDLVKNNPSLKDFGKSVLTFFILTSGDNKQLTFPMAKVEKYLHNGKEDSLHFYATVISKLKD